MIQYTNLTMPELETTIIVYDTFTCVKTKKPMLIVIIDYSSYNMYANTYNIIANAYKAKNYKRVKALLNEVLTGKAA